MEATPNIPEILIPATPAPATAGAGPVGAAPLARPETPAPGAGQPPEPSEFSNTFNKLKDSEVSEAAAAEQPAEASGTPADTAAEPPGTPDAQLRLALPLDAATEAGPDALRTNLPESGKVLPATGDSLPALATTSLTATDTELAAEAPTAQPASPSQPVTTPAATLTALAAANAEQPALPGNPELAIKANTLAPVAANFAGQPAGLTQARNAGTDSLQDYVRLPPDVLANDMKPATEITVQTLRTLVMQIAPADSARIALPQGADAGLAAPLHAAPTGAAAAFTDTLAELLPPTSQPALQPAGDRGAFAQGLGERLVMMADNGLQSVRIKLYPEHLGPLDIKVQVDDDVARVWFHAQHGQTRDALEQALPRLREMFAEQGLVLVRSEVADSGEEFRDRLAESAVPEDPAVSGAVEADGHDQAVALGMPMSIGGARLLDVMA